MRRAQWRQATVVALVIAITSLGLSASSATTGGPQGPAADDNASSCDLYPIAASSSLLRGARVGKVIKDLTVGTPSGHEGWLTWTGDVSEPTLAKSLTGPGDSERYVNPDDATDRVLSLGDWVKARPGAVSSSSVRSALDELKGETIVVPVWDSTRGTGANVAYHVSEFADVQITSYVLNNDNRISAKYLGPSTCTTPDPGPLAQPTSATTSEDQPVTITLTGTDTGSSPDLTFRLTAPAHGTVNLVGQPSCLRADDLACTATAVYTPAADFNGLDEFSFTVSDGGSESTAATVSITVTEVNDPPVAGADSASAGSEPLELAAALLLANDVPGPANESGQTLTLTAVNAGPDTHGTVSLAGGTITYIPDAGFAGPASFTYTVCDNGTTAGQPDPLCADGLVTLAVAPAANEPPVGEPATVDAVEDTARPITLDGRRPRRRPADVRGDLGAVTRHVVGHRAGPHLHPGPRLLRA